MEKYIKADTVFKFINGCLEHEDKITDTEKAVLTGVKTCIERIPVADVVEVKHGRWIWKGHYLICSECDHESDRTNYCPNCGAKMDGEESVLIRGMEMPKGRPVCIVIDAAGQARRYDLNNDRYADDELFEVVPVPPHGRLIDASELQRDIHEHDYVLVDKWNSTDKGMFTHGIDYAISIAPTIIEAEPPKEEAECSK